MRAMRIMCLAGLLVAVPAFAVSATPAGRLRNTANGGGPDVVYAPVTLAATVDGYGQIDVLTGTFALAHSGKPGDTAIASKTDITFGANVVTDLALSSTTDTTSTAPTMTALVTSNGGGAALSSAISAGATMSGGIPFEWDLQLVVGAKSNSFGTLAGSGFTHTGTGCVVGTFLAGGGTVLNGTYDVVINAWLKSGLTYTNTLARNASTDVTFSAINLVLSEH